MEEKAKILVVEDERIVAEDIRRSLKKLGYEVSAVVSNGEEALQKAMQIRPDLVLMDIVLRKTLSGIQTAQKMHEWSDLPIVYLTAYADDETIERAKKTQPYGYILKPFEDRELQTTIEMALYKHRTELKIKENEAWLSTTLKSIAEAVVATNDRGEILFMNPVAEQITGWTFQEVAGKPFGKVFHLLHHQMAIENPVARVLASREGAGFSMQCEWLHMNGRPVIVDINASPIRQANGNVLGAVLAFQDITQRIQTEEALEKSEHEKRLILSSVSEMLFYLDLDLRIIWANEAAGRTVHMDPERMKGRRCHDVWHGRRKPCRTCPVENMIGTGEASEVETETEDGRIWISRAYPVRNEGGDLVGAVEVIRDITRQKQVEDQLQKERDFINTLIQASPAFYVAVDAADRTLLMNQTMLKTLGYVQDEVIGAGFVATFAHPDDREALHSRFQDLIQKHEPLLVEARILDKKGHEFVVEWHGRAVTDKKGKFEYGFVLGLDVTQRKRAEKERERVESQLQQIQKMEAIGTLTGGVAHDFNNLLTAILGCADMAILRVDKQNPIYRDLHEIQNASLRASDLTRQLLLFSSKHPTKFMPLDLNQIVGDLLKMLHRLIGEDIGISTVFHPYLWTVRGDKGTLEQVLMNLTVNARDAMPKGGKITIRNDNVNVDHDYCIEFPEARTGDFVRLSVSDTGAGIDPRVLPHIFEPFFSTKGPGKGTGLGLSVVYGIVRQHSGWITVSSLNGKGTTFDVYLPTVKEKAATTSDEKISIKDFKGDGERILVVEDAQGIREFLRTALAESGYNAFIASNCAEAKQLFSQHKGRFDLVFSDVVLPDKSGIELVEDLLEKKPDLKVLLSSGYTDQKSQWAIIQNKKMPFLQKPYSLLFLLRLIKEVINNK